MKKYSFYWAAGKFTTVAPTMKQALIDLKAENPGLDLFNITNGDIERV